MFLVLNDESASPPTHVELHSAGAPAHDTVSFSFDGKSCCCSCCCSSWMGASLGAAAAQSVRACLWACLSARRGKRRARLGCSTTAPTDLLAVLSRHPPVWQGRPCMWLATV